MVRRASWARLATVQVGLIGHSRRRGFLLYCCGASFLYNRRWRGCLYTRRGIRPLHGTFPHHTWATRYYARCQSQDRDYQNLFHDPSPYLFYFYWCSFSCSHVFGMRRFYSSTTVVLFSFTLLELCSWTDGATTGGATVVVDLLSVFTLLELCS